MAFSDFLIHSATYSQTLNAATFSEPISGTAILNSTLSSPLTGSTYCRQFDRQIDIITGFGSNHARSNHIFITSSVSGGVFVDTNNSYSLSLRAKIRQTFLSRTSTNGLSDIGLCGYSPLPSGSNNINLNAGYLLSFYSKDSATSGLNLRLIATVGQSDTNDLNAFYPDNNAKIVVCSGSYSTDQWYHVRMDIIPLSLTQKRLLAYTSSNDGSTWTEIGNMVVDSSIDGTNFRNSGYNGFYLYDFASGGSPSSNHYSAYIDKFEAYVSIP